MNLIKTPLSTRLMQENLQNQMRIVVNGSSFQDYDPDPSVMHWLKCANRHITHKEPVKVKQLDPTEEPSTSQSDSTTAKADMSIIQPVLMKWSKYLVEKMLQDKNLKVFLKEPGSCALM